MKMVRVFATGIAIGYLIGSGKARELIERLQAASGSGGPQRLAPARWRKVSLADAAGPAPSDVAVFQPVPDAGARSSGVVAGEAARGA
jgi:hypothetical protein